MQLRLLLHKKHLKGQTANLLYSKLLELDSAQPTALNIIKWSISNNPTCSYLKLCGCMLQSLCCTNLCNYNTVTWEKHFLHGGCPQLKLFYWRFIGYWSRKLHISLPHWSLQHTADYGLFCCAKGQSHRTDRSPPSAPPPRRVTRAIAYCATGSVCVKPVWIKE